MRTQKINMSLSEKNLREKFCLPLALILLTFEKAHGPISGHFGVEKTFIAVNEHFYFPGLYKWIRGIVNDCIRCQASKAQKKTLNTAPLIPFSELTPNFNFRISIDTKGPINPPSNGNSYIISILEAFSHFTYPHQYLSAMDKP